MLYVWECKNCGRRKEVIRILKEIEIPPAKVCQHCTIDEGWIRICANVGFRLKGGCWARDGYATHVGDALKNGGTVDTRD